MAKLLAIDLDGTLFYPKQIKRCIPKKNAKFLKNWIDQGNKVVLVTSRSHDFTERLKQEINRPVDFINCTSCQIYVDDQLIRNDKIDNADICQIVNEIDEKYKPIAFLITSKNYPCLIKNCGRVGKSLLWIYYFYWLFQFKYREPFLIDNQKFYEELENGDVYKIMIFFGFGKNKKVISKEINKRLRESYPNIESSWVSIVNDITPLNCNKGFGLKKYVEYTKTNPDDVYVIGDSGNDISMFEAYYKNSYCMKHAYPSVKKYAKYEISRVFKLEKLVLKGEKNE